ncbi:MAG: Rpn family recombination-promoting nuclease/putative transposase [Lachnospiraceae bacterium]|nr:Rpn family recombination-promoting nuclease/putative transposase [Lachnospiraceae bacterium]
MSLTIKDSFMFYAVMSDPEQCRRLLTLTLDMEIETVTLHREETIIYHPDYHGIRLDVTAVENGTRRRFNVEMQAQIEKEIARRSRYYHSQLDSDTLLAGHDYDELPDTYVIFICDFDPVGAGLYRYSLEMTCRETGTALNDGIYTIFLSTKGKNKDAVPPELVSFLEYVGDPSTRERSKDSFVRSLDTQISTIKRNREWRGKYMLMELMMAEERKEGHEEGREEGIEEGIPRGELRKVIDLCCRKLIKGKSVEEIADALECDISQIRTIVNVAQKYAPDYDVDRILEELSEEPLP